jgi:hypothetical protein
MKHTRGLRFIGVVMGVSSFFRVSLMDPAILTLKQKKYMLQVGVIIVTVTIIGRLVCNITKAF